MLLNLPSYNIIKLRFKKLLKSKFILDFTKLSTSGAIGKSLYLLFTPLITRIYSPEQFAQFALFTSLITVIYPIYSGRYEFAILTARKESQIKKLFYLTILLVLIFSCISFFIFFILSNINSQFLNLKSLNLLIYLIPFGIAVEAFLNTLKLIASRYKKFLIISKSVLLNYFVKVLLCLLFGFFSKNYNGLIISNVICTAITCIFLTKQLNLKIEFKIFRGLKSIFATAKKFWKYPIYNSIPSVVDNITYELPVFIISMIYAGNDLANYAIVSTIFIYPIALFSSSLSQVNFSHISFKVRSGLYIFDDTKKLLFVLFIFIGLPCLILFFYSRNLIPIIFGNQWNDAAIYLQILIPSFFIRIVASTLSNILISTNRNELLGLWQVGSFITSLVVLIFSAKNLNFFNFILSLSFLNMVIYSVYLILIIYSAKNPRYNFKN